MNQRLARICATILFSASLAVTVVIGSADDVRSAGGGGPPPSGEEAGAAGDRAGLVLEEVAADRGLVFRHQSPQLDERLDHIMPLVVGMGAGVSVVDYDGDGDQDVYALTSRQGEENALFENQGDGSFVNVAAEVGLADLNRPGTGVSMSAVWGDVDNDGDEDVFVAKWGRSVLLENEERPGGGRRFVDVEHSALPAWANANAAVWLDYDRDGNLDLFLAGYWPDELDLWHLETSEVMPESFEYAGNGGGKWLLRGDGEGGFVDVTEEAGIDSRRWTLAVAAPDLTGDGYPDLFLSNDFGHSELYASRGGERFEEVGEAVGLAETPKSGMCAALGDPLLRGRLAVYESNITEKGILVQGNNLWVPMGEGEELLVQEMAPALGLAAAGWSWGAQFGDLDHDGWPDLFVANGFVSADEKRSYWYDYAQIAGGHKEIISDAENWPPMKGRSLSGAQRSRVWLNDGAGRFFDVAGPLGVDDRLDGRAVALADLTGRGALDVLVANQGGRLLVYEARPPAGRAWAALELEGTKSNKSAIGAEVVVRWGGRTHLQQVTGGQGFAAQNMRRLHFGLGPAEELDSIDVEVRWPSGAVQELEGLKPGRVHRLVEGEGAIEAGEGPGEAER